MVTILFHNNDSLIVLSILRDRKMEATLEAELGYMKPGVLCPKCRLKGENSKLEFLELSYDEACVLCENTFCPYQSFLRTNFSGEIWQDEPSEESLRYKFDDTIESIFRLDELENASDKMLIRGLLKIDTMLTELESEDQSLDITSHSWTSEYLANSERTNARGPTYANSRKCNCEVTSAKCSAHTDIFESFTGCVKPTTASFQLKCEEPVNDDSHRGDVKNEDLIEMHFNEISQDNTQEMDWQTLLDSRSCEVRESKIAELSSERLSDYSPKHLKCFSLECVEKEEKYSSSEAYLMPAIVSAVEKAETMDENVELDYKKEIEDLLAYGESKVSASNPEVYPLEDLLCEKDLQICQMPKCNQVIPNTKNVKENEQLIDRLSGEDAPYPAPEPFEFIECESDEYEEKCVLCENYKGINVDEPIYANCRTSKHVVSLAKCSVLTNTMESLTGSVEQTISFPLNCDEPDTDGSHTGGVDTEDLIEMHFNEISKDNTQEMDCQKLLEKSCKESEKQIIKLSDEPKSKPKYLYCLVPECFENEEKKYVSTAHQIPATFLGGETPEKMNENVVGSNKKEIQIKTDGESKISTSICTLEDLPYVGDLEVGETSEGNQVLYNKSVKENELQIDSLSNGVSCPEPEPFEFLVCQSNYEEKYYVPEDYEVLVDVLADEFEAPDEPNENTEEGDKEIQGTAGEIEIVSISKETEAAVWEETSQIKEDRGIEGDTADNNQTSADLLAGKLELVLVDDDSSVSIDFMSPESLKPLSGISQNSHDRVIFDDGHQLNTDIKEASGPFTQLHNVPQYISDSDDCIILDECQESNGKTEMRELCRPVSHTECLNRKVNCVEFEDMLPVKCTRKEKHSINLCTPLDLESCSSEPSNSRSGNGKTHPKKCLCVLCKGHQNKELTKYLDRELFDIIPQELETHTQKKKDCKSPKKTI